MGNVVARRKRNMSPFRKIAIGTWQTTYDPSIHGGMQLRADAVLDYIQKFRAKTGKKLTITHVITKALALALVRCPEANAILRWNTIYERETIDISVIVMMEEDGKIDLSSAKLRQVDKMSFVEMIDTLSDQVARIRAHQDAALEKTRQSMQWVPALLMNVVLKLLAFVAYTLNINLERFGVPKDAFGGALVTSIGPLGLDVGYPPLLPYSRAPILIAPGEAHDAAVVVDGRLEVGKVITVNATFDHRVVDGAHCAILARAVREIFEAPFKFFDAV